MKRMLMIVLIFFTTLTCFGQNEMGALVNKVDTISKKLDSALNLLNKRTIQNSDSEDSITFYLSQSESLSLYQNECSAECCSPVCINCPKKPFTITKKQFCIKKVICKKTFEKRVNISNVRIYFNGSTIMKIRVTPVGDGGFFCNTDSIQITNINTSLNDKYLHYQGTVYGETWLRVSDFLQIWTFADKMEFRKEDFELSLLHKQKTIKK